MSTTINPSDQTITQYNIQTGGANNLLNNVAPSSTSGVPVISQGASSQPIFGTAVVAGGGTGDISFTAYALITGGTTSTGALQNVSGVGTSGQILTSNGAGALPTWQAAPSSGGISLNYITSTTFSVNGTWTKNGSTKQVKIYMWAGGGGGGGGGSSGAGGGGGGAAGGCLFYLGSSAYFGASETVTIGSGGGGGAAATGGSDGTLTSVGNLTVGSVGSGGKTANGATGGVANVGLSIISQYADQQVTEIYGPFASGAGGNTNTVGTSGTSTSGGGFFSGAAGGGGGGGGNSPANGGAGNSVQSTTGASNLAAGGAAGTGSNSIVGTNGITTPTAGGIVCGGGGGGGGKAVNSGTGQVGGAGAVPGGGGGGGGGAGSTGTGGAGGAGGNGYVIIYEYG